MHELSASLMMLISLECQGGQHKSFMVHDDLEKISPRNSLATSQAHKHVLGPTGPSYQGGGDFWLVSLHAEINVFMCFSDQRLTRFFLGKLQV